MAKVLIVDDENSIRFLAKTLLQKEGHEIDIAENGRECFEKLESYKPDLILLDVMMPGENGWEVCRQIKNNDETNNIRVLMFTVRSQVDDIKKSLEYAGAEGHISKPFTIEDFNKEIRKFIA